MRLLRNILGYLFIFVSLLEITENSHVAVIGILLGALIIPRTWKLLSTRFGRVFSRKEKLVTIMVAFIFFVGVLPDTQRVSSQSQTTIVSSVGSNKSDSKEKIEKEEGIVHTNKDIVTENTIPQTKLYSVVKVVDGDTVDVDVDGKTERVRLIGVNTPETVDPRKSIECFGKEASDKAKKLLSSQKVSLEADTTQGDRDKYDRLLRYVFLENGENFSLFMIQQGYGYEYTYELPYKYQSQFKQAQKEASDNKVGLWATGACVEQLENKNMSEPTSDGVSESNTSSCTIKGNISSTGEKIYHLEDCASYSKTVIDQSKDEQWFCSEGDAQNAGWRKALNCK